MLTGCRADAARDRDELRADLRARAEHAERQADAYRDELAQLRAGIVHDTDPIRTTRTSPRVNQTAKPYLHHAPPPRLIARPGGPLQVVTYESSLVSRLRSFTFAKMASCATRGMSSQIAEAATQRSASWSFPPSPCPVLAHHVRTVT
jgi:hypothetical protein